MDVFLTILLVLGFISICLFGLGVQLYGAYLSFKKAWYVGAIALFVPGFAFVIGLAKMLGKDFLAK